MHELCSSYEESTGFQLTTASHHRPEMMTLSHHKPGVMTVTTQVCNVGLHGFQPEVMIAFVLDPKTNKSLKYLSSNFHDHCFPGVFPAPNFV